MEKTTIQYEKLTAEELVKIWKDDAYEWKTFLEETNLQACDILQALEYDDVGYYINDIITHAKNCNMYYCNQCSCFIENSGYIHSLEECLDCAVGNGH